MQGAWVPSLLGELGSHVLGSKKTDKVPSTDEWIKKMWYTYTTEYYSAIERNGIGSFVETWMDLETVIQSEASQKEKNKYRYVNAYTWNLEKW